MQIVRINEQKNKNSNYRRDEHLKSTIKVILR